MAETIATRIPTMRMTALTGAWATIGAAASTVTAAVEPSNSSGNLSNALIIIGGGVLAAFVGPLATAWARTLFHRKNYRTEQEALNDHLIEEMDRLSRDNEALREENAELRRRRR